MTYKKEKIFYYVIKSFNDFLYIYKVFIKHQSVQYIHAICWDDMQLTQTFHYYIVHR
jgi:hypothetical protein